MSALRIAHREYFHVAALSLILLLLYELIFGHFLSPANPRLYGDHALFLPWLLDGYYWHVNNGWFSLYWFTPAFCGGLPVFANPQSPVLSLLQWLTAFTDPVRSIHITMLLMAEAGFLGMYLMLRKSFGLKAAAALLGAVLFMFNGFFAYRMIVGHLSYHAYMLLPWIAWLLLDPPDRRHGHGVARIMVSGILLAYMVYSGLIHLFLPVVLAVLLLGTIHSLQFGSFGAFMGRFAVAGVVALLLAGAKLTASIAYVGHFPRDHYPLAGVASLWKLLLLLGDVLFFRPDEDTGLVLANSRWKMLQHEFEFGVTLVPLICLFLPWKRQGPATRWFGSGTIRGTGGAVGLKIAFAGVLLALPLALNYYQPAWNAFLKQLPIIKSSTILIRWFALYIPVVILFAAFAIHRWRMEERYRLGGALILCSLVILFQGLSDKHHYERPGYDRRPVMEAWYKAREEGPPPVDVIAAYEKEGEVGRPHFRNNALIEGASQLYCEESIFGYRLERFPFKQLGTGPVHTVVAGTLADGVLNMKNPACYVWPDANQCHPGDHFSTAELDKLERFRRYRPYPFEISRAQYLANRVTLVSIVVVVVVLVIGTARTLRRVL